MNKLTPALIRMLAKQGLPLSAKSIPAPDMWKADGPQIPPARMDIRRPMDALPVAFSGQQEIPGPQVIQDEEGNTPIWFNAACPPWICPPLWSVAVDLPQTACVPWYEVQTLIGTVAIPKGYLLVIKSVSYEAANAVQGDVVQFVLSVNGQPYAEWEDMVTDAAQVNPTHRMGLSGHIRELPLHVIVPPNAAVTIAVTLAGAIDFNGVSPNWPGQPILTPDCHVKVLFNGWYFPATNNVEGAPRQWFVGDQGNWLMGEG